jgi:DNA-directed RNA polymerase subunit H
MSPTRTRSRRSTASKSPADAPEARPFVAHHLVPPHELLSETETASVLTELGTSAERLPKILASDPGLKTDPKYVAAREAHEPLAGRLVRIRRPSATAGQAVAYRIIADHVGE